MPDDAVKSDAFPGKNAEFQPSSDHRPRKTPSPPQHGQQSSVKTLNSAGAEPFFRQNAARARANEFLLTSEALPQGSSARRQLELCSGDN
jgi:hypothetical protein